jgi:arylsulfatase A-like enzyme
LILVFLCCGREPHDRASAAARFLAEALPSSGVTVNRAGLPSLRKSGFLSVPLTLQDDTRRSIVPPAAGRVQIPVDIPPESVLRFAIAAATLSDPEFDSPLQFRITLRDRGREETLFRETLRRRDRNRWLDREISLADWGGAKAQLALEVGDDAAEDVFPVWGNPVILPARSPAESRQMILISIDCLRADHVGANGYERDTTPHIDAFAKDAVVFERAIATSATTLPTHMSMLTGLTPSEHGASNRHRLSPSVAYLPELLASAGFQADAVVSGAYVSQYFGFERGFHSYLSLHHPRASETVDAALLLLDRTEGGDRFLFLHLIDPHWPYRPPAGHEERFGPIRTNVDRVLQKVLDQIPPDGPAEVEQARDLYDAEIAYADRELGRFLDELRARGLYETALIVLTADHGEAFYEHGSWQHGWTLFDEVVRIPLIVKWPGAGRPPRVNHLASQVDIFATLLQYAGIPAPHARSTSLEALGERERRYVVSEFLATPDPAKPPHKKVAFRSESQKYIVTFRTGDDDLTVSEIESEELYDLAKDPGELQDLFPRTADEASELRRVLHTYLEQSRAQRGKAVGQAVDEDELLRQRLRSLGYLTSP